MSKGFEGRLIRLERFHRDALGRGCMTCRSWGHVVYQFRDGLDDPPPICPTCGRDRPDTRGMRIYDLPLDFDQEVTA